MPTKKPQFIFPVADKEDYDRVSALFQKEFGTINGGMRAAVNAMLKRYGQPPLKELEWGGNRTGTKGGKKKQQ